jgi:DNA-binding LytR/AlgR family response regulator
MKVVIIEDESHSAKKLQQYLMNCYAEIEVMAVLPGIRESIAYLRENPEPELIFLDIQLSDGPSFNIFKEVQIESYVIFLTAYEDFALQAFDLNSVDYILKPFTEEDIARGLKKYENMVLSRSGGIRNSSAGLAQYRNRFLVRKGQQIHTVHVQDIAYFYKDEVVMLVKTDGTTFLYDATLEELEEQLNPTAFFRINRQFLVNYNSISSLVPGSSNRYLINLQPATRQEVYVSQGKVAPLKAWLTI